MAVWSVANHHSLMASGRADAEFFHPAFLEAESQLTCIETTVIARYFDISDGNHLEVSRWFTDEYDAVPYYRGQDLNGFFLEKATPVRIPRRIYDQANMHRSHFLPEDVLICIVGASTGTISVVTSNANRCTGSCKIGIVRRHPSGVVDPYVLAAFLLGKFGQYQIARHSRGTAQGGLILRDIFKLLVPVLPNSEQELIRRFVGNALLLSTQAIALYSEAERLLEVELGLDKLTYKKPIGYTAQFSELETSRRFDPEHYYPAFDDFARSLPRGISLSPLRKHLTFCKRGKQPIYLSAGLRVINSKHVQPNRVLIDGNRFAAANPDSNLQIRDGDTLLNGTGRGTLGRAAPYLIAEPAVPDNHVTILRSDDLDPVYLSLYLNSAAGQMQVEMFQRGTSGQLELYPFDIRRFLVWPAPESLQRELRGLHEKAAAAERESKQLLEQAKSRVEQLIEEAARA
ncbi:hypothetical protein [uncultured Lamprocystis sp.]|jgi:hypothetical protein|uniref:hypothetical protein n=1 Tax=uncultured Lamprocystis sp. TaxID=543132 RepID=UPI0025E595F3|nr:hypothetical protein [uncultured Lamprocystis sp.]